MKETYYFAYGSNMNLDPVSYTHLDVYKRQTQDSMDILLRYEELFQKQSQCKREWREQR